MDKGIKALMNEQIRSNQGTGDFFLSQESLLCCCFSPEYKYRGYGKKNFSRGDGHPEK